MIEYYKYSDAEKKELLSSMVYIVDTREQQNSHILEVWDSAGTKYIHKKMDTGDYSFMVPKNEKLGIFRDLWFDKEVMVERKGSLEELSGNLTKDRVRFKEEMTLGPPHKVLLVENADYDDIIMGKYETGMNRKAFLASIHSIWFRYNCPFVFLPYKSSTPVFLKYYFENYLKHRFQ